MGFEISYRGEWRGAFEHESTGSEAEQLQAVVLELLTQVQDLVTETSTMPWPLVVVDGRKNFACPDAVVEGARLHMWYGDRDAPTVTVPSVDLI